MLSVQEALNLVLEQASPGPPEKVSLGPACLGLILAEDITSDLDSPPHDKAMMDGYAVRSADLPSGRGTLTVIEEVTAGRTPQFPVQAGQATRIMTGAPVPAGADAVVMVERTRPVGNGQVEIEDRPPSPGQNVLPRGREMRRGEVVLTAGTRLRPQELGTLATVGRSSVWAHLPAEVAVLSTGDELVEADASPGPGQIRNGNGPMLAAQVARAGGTPRYLGIARDDVDSLRPLIEDGLESPVLILSGGVSAGKLDLVPGVLRKLGVEAVFHKVEMKPGKPVFFGTREGTLVFGLPGNPVSALICFELFVRPALRRWRGEADARPRMVQAALAEDFSHRSDRPTYYPARLEAGNGALKVRPVAWFGSPDLRGLLQANAFAVFPAGEATYRAGQLLDVLRVEDWD